MRGERRARDETDRETDPEPRDPQRGVAADEALQQRLRDDRGDDLGAERRDEDDRRESPGASPVERRRHGIARRDGAGARQDLIDPRGPQAGQRESQRADRDRQSRVDVLQQHGQVRADRAGEADADQRDADRPGRSDGGRVMVRRRDARGLAHAPEQREHRRPQRRRRGRPHEDDDQQRQRVAALGDPRHREQRGRRQQRDRCDDAPGATPDVRDAIDPHARDPVAGREDRLVRDQHVDEPSAIDARGGEHRRQEQHVHRPRQREQALDDEHPHGSADARSRRRLDPIVSRAVHRPSAPSRCHGPRRGARDRR